MKKPVEKFFSDSIEWNESGGGQSGVGFRLDLMDPYATLELGRILKNGAERYAPDNWRKIDVGTHVNHALGHILAHMAGDRTDPHLSHALCRLHFAVALHDGESENVER